MEIDRLTTVFDSDLTALERGFKRAGDLRQKYLRDSEQGFKASEREAQRAFQGVTRAAEQSFAKMEGDARGFSSRVSRILSSIRGGALAGGGSGGGSDGGGFLSMLSGAVQLLPGLNVLAGGISKVTGALSSGVKMGFDYRRTLEENSIAFEVMLKSGDKAKSLLTDLARIAEKSPFEFPEVIQTTKQMLAMGYSVDEIKQRVLTLSDAASSLGVPMEQIVRALGQMRAKGKVSFEEMNQLSEAGVDSWRYVAEAIAKVDANFNKLSADKQKARAMEYAQAGRLDARGAEQAILIGLRNDVGGVGERVAAETASGLESNIHDVASRLAGTASKAAFDEYKNLLRTVLTGLNTNTAEAFAEGASGVTGAVFKGVTGRLHALGFDAVGSFSSGAGGAAGEAHKAGVAAGDALEQGVRDRLDQHSPSRVMLALGRDAGLSLVEGFAQGTKGRRLGEETERIIEEAIEEAAARYGLDPNLIRAVMKRESGGHRKAVSPKGASGLMQLMPGTAAHYGVKNIFDPAQNIDAGAHYLADLIKMFEGDLRLVFAAYNAGPGAVNKYGGVPPFAETRAYVPAVMRNYTRLSTGVDGPVPVVITNGPGGAARGGMTADEGHDLAELLRERKAADAASRDHVEALQLEQRRLSRLVAGLNKDIGSGPLSEAANSDLAAKRDELEAALESNSKELEKYWLTQTEILNKLDAKIKAIKDRAAARSAALTAPAGLSGAADLPTAPRRDFSSLLQPGDASPRLGPAPDEPLARAAASAIQLERAIKEAGGDAGRMNGELTQTVSILRAPELAKKVRELTRVGVAEDFRASLSDFTASLGRLNLRDAGREAALSFLEGFRRKLSDDFASLVTDKLFGDVLTDGKRSGGVGEKLLGALGVGKHGAEGAADAAQVSALHGNTLAENHNSVAVEKLTAVISSARLSTGEDFDRLFHGAPASGSAEIAGGRLTSEADLERFFNDSLSAARETVSSLHEAKHSLDDINASVNTQGLLTFSAIHELENTMIALQPRGPGLLGQILIAAVNAAGSALAGKFGGDDDDEDYRGNSSKGIAPGPAPGANRDPQGRPILRRATGGPVPAWTPAILAEEGYEAVIFDRPGHVLNHSDSHDFIQNVFHNSHPSPPSEQRIRHSGSIEIREPTRKPPNSYGTRAGSREVQDAVIKRLLGG